MVLVIDLGERMEAEMLKQQKATGVHDSVTPAIVRAS
jgi:hypothetical protein